MEIWELFTGFSKAHGNHTPEAKSGSGKSKGTSATLTDGGATVEDWKRHLRGESPGIGIFPLLDDNKSVRFGALDIDDHTIDHSALEQRCESYGLPVVISKSKSNGAHVWVFFSETVSAERVLLKLTEWAALLGYGGCEVFPKQTSRGSDVDLGNWINMPYFGSSRRAIKSGKEITVSAFCKYAEERLQTYSSFMAVDPVEEGDEFSDGPPCLQYLSAQGVEEGSRNTILFNVAVYLKLKYGSGWPEYLIDYNDSLDEPLPSREIEAIIKSIGAKEYGFTCNQVPLSNHCQRSKCYKREFGIGGGEDVIEVEIRGLTKLLTEPPRWILDLEGTRMEVSTPQLMKQTHFQQLCIEAVNRFPNTIKKKTYDRLISDLLANVEEVEAPEEASPRGQFFLYLDEFIEYRLTKEVQDITNGGVYQTEENDEPVVLFRSTDFFEFLKRKGFTHFTHPQMWSLLKQRRACQKQIRINGIVRRLWQIGLPDVVQTEEFTVPPIEEAF